MNISIISVFPPSNMGGAEVVWKNLKNKIKFKNISLKEKDLPKYLKIIPNNFHLKEIFCATFLMKKAIKQNSKIIIYEKIFGWPKIKGKFKKVCYNHGSYTIAGLNFKNKNLIIYLFYKYVLGFFEKKSYKNSDKIIAVSNNVRNEMISNFNVPKRKIVVINNGVDLNIFRHLKTKKKLREKYNLPKNKKIIFFPGRPSFGKGFDIAKKVMKKIDKDYVLIVLGNHKFNQKNILSMGKIPHKEMPEIYNCADLCLFPSRYEGNSLSILESAACNTPLILSKVGLMKTERGMEEFIGNSIQEYVFKIQKINLKEAAKKWKNFSKKFNLEKQVKELNNFLKNEIKK